MKEVPDSEFENLFSSARDLTASADLRDRAERAARLHQSTTTQKRPSRLRLVLAAGSAAAILALVLLTPATLLGKTAAALNGVRTIQMKSYDVVNGVPRPAEQVWYSNGDWRIENRGSIEIYHAGNQWSRAAGSPTVVERVRRPGEVPVGMEGGVQIKNLIATLASHTNSFEISYGPEENANGHRTQSIIATRKGHDERDIILVDLKSDLPIRMEHDLLVGGAWKLATQAEFVFDAPVSASLFEPSFGADARIVDLDMLRSGYVQKWSLPHGLPALKAEGSETVIRDTFVNERGWVFVLWTGRIGDRYHRLTLTDNQGNAYMRTEFNPGAIPYNESKLPLVNVGGEVVDGAWFVPIKDVDVARIGRYSLAASRLKIDTTGGDGSQREYWFRRPWETTEVESAPENRRYTLTPVGSTSFPRPPISTALLPDFAPIFQDSPPTETFAESRAIDGRLWYWLGKLSESFSVPGVNFGEGTPTRFVAGGPVVYPPQIGVPGQGLAGGPFDRTALDEVARLVRQEITLTKNADATGEGSAFDWYALSLVERELGQNSAAAQDLQVARRVRPELNWGAGSAP